MQGTGIRPPRCRSASHCCRQAGRAHGSTETQPGMIKGKSQCPGTRISLPSLPEPSAPSLGWGPFTPSCLSFPPAHRNCSNSSPASGSPWPHAGRAAHCPLWLLGSVPSRTQAALVCSLASVPALPSPPRARRCHCPDPQTGWSGCQFLTETAWGNRGPDPKPSSPVLQCQARIHTHTLIPSSACVPLPAWWGWLGWGCEGQMCP